jgi:transaldolase
MPEKTLDAFADHGEVQGDMVSGKAAEAQAVFDQLDAAGIDLPDVFRVLEEEGVQKFVDAWDELTASVGGELEKLA